MHTELYESDPFTPKKGKLLATLDTDYRFERNDELTVESAGGRVPVRVMHVRIAIKDGALRREILALRL